VGDIVINAYSYGNILCLVNDPSNQIFPDYVEGVPNVEINTILINGFPFSVMYTCNTIEKGMKCEAASLVTVGHNDGPVYGVGCLSD
jgi:hypothetical protein